MAYIYLDELKEILPEILSSWIDKDDESWEWIFSKIEHKCYVGTKHKDKKRKKYAEDDIFELKRDICDLNGWLKELNKKYDELRNKISNLGDKYTSMVTKVNHMYSDINTAKSMAETAKLRTEIDYSKYSSKSDGEKMCKTCKYSSNIDGSPKSFDAPPCDTCNHNNNWEAKDD